MSKIVLTEVTAGTNLTSINDNFTELARQLNDLVLYRDNPEGETNTVQGTIDLNQNAMIHMELNEQAMIPFDKIIKVEIYEYSRKNSVKKIFIVAGTVTAVTLAIGIGLIHLMDAIFGISG